MNNLYAASHPKGAELRVLLAEWLQSTNDVISPMDQADLDALRSLGYIE
jgi:hypothetical protein